jgi:glycosyltransferase involved in cell wall biosynthesis
MKIVLVNNYYYLRGGSERVLLDDESALVALGHDVFPFAPQDERNIVASTEPFPNVDGYDSGTIRGKAIAAMSVIYSAKAARAFSEFLDRHSVEIIHCHNIYGRLTTAVLDVAKQQKVPVVLTAHDRKLVCPAYLGLRQGKPCERCIDGRYWRCVQWRCHKQSATASLVYAVESYYNQLLRKYDTVQRFLCPSRFMQESLVSSGVAASRTAYHPNALPVSQYAPGFSAGDYVLYAGRLSAEKGLKTLLRAFERLAIPLRIAGTGPLEPDIRKALGGGKRHAQLEGYCTGEKLASLYKNCAFSVVPSECLENASMSILESLAYGKPVLASAIGGNPELVVDGETGRLFPPGDTEALCEAARKMWDGRGELEAMGRNARRLMEQRFHHGRRIRDLIGIYRDVIAENQRKRLAGPVNPAERKGHRL